MGLQRVYMGKHKAKSLGWFLRKVAYDYARYGYHHYALREIPQGKDLEAVDQKLLSIYQITYCRTTRARRRKNGLSNVALVRYKRWFLLLGTDGRHETFSRVVTRDFRIAPLHFGGYSVGLKNQEPSVMITPNRMTRIREIALKIALHNDQKLLTSFTDFLSESPLISFLESFFRSESYLQK